jgi:hypothetical protein
VEGRESTFCEDNVFVEGGGKFEAFGRFLPGVVID